MLAFRRLYHISHVSCSLKKQGIKLNKMINPKSKKQSWHPAPDADAILPSVKSLTKVKHDPGKRGLKRTAMLNKMFMKQITDIMSTGTVAINVIGRGIEISKVSVTPNFQGVNVYWVCKGKASDDETQAILNKVAGLLRHELSTLRIMGEIPYIIFVKDQQEAHLVDLDRRLAMADYGEDYVLTEEGHLLKSEFVLNTQLSPEVKAKIKQLEEELPAIEEPIPEMTHNIFGLDHAKILNRLLAARKKSRDAWMNLDEQSGVISYRAPANETLAPAVGNQRKELADFLVQRQILHKRIKAQQRKDRADYQLTQQEEQDSGFESDEYLYDDDEFDADDDLSHNDYDYREPLDTGNHGPPPK